MQALYRNPVRVKICGITTPADAQLAAVAGADAIGMVFYPPSPRNVAITDAQQILAAVPPFVTRVGLFVNPQRAWVEEVLAACALDMLQFHGDEEPEFCAGFQRPYLKVLRVSGECDLRPWRDRFGTAQGLLLDKRDAQVFGGSGQSFAWWRLPQDLGIPLILAGGLHPENVATAIDVARPYAVDVSSGVEVSPGRKDRGKMERFIAQAHAAREA
ncbi:phosphoribosylanthranilate isomerase [Acidithiobacillus sp. AMEEHan]|uniref:phosphoribosylanthranilate isomerase n=1 Tax=Acidithiobacillus sp. AMEEHan TaxID=2994951 RepID=UPI0027E3B403|nr:phosphoribosylanthranilate isomerase [Acidithiobacillus sp. AMEEHan]